MYRSHGRRHSPGCCELDHRPEEEFESDDRNFDGGMPGEFTPRERPLDKDDWDAFDAGGLKGHESDAREGPNPDDDETDPQRGDFWTEPEDRERDDE